MWTNQVGQFCSCPLSQQEMECAALGSCYSYIKKKMVVGDCGKTQIRVTL